MKYKFYCVCLEAAGDALHDALNVGSVPFLDMKDDVGRDIAVVVPGDDVCTNELALLGGVPHLGGAGAVRVFENAPERGRG